MKTLKKPKAKKSGLKKKVIQKGSSFKSEINKIAKKDPEFYEYLKFNETDIFEFSDDEDKSDENSINSIENEEENSKDNSFQSENEENEFEEESDSNYDNINTINNSKISSKKCLEILKSSKLNSVKIFQDETTRKKLIDENLINFLTKVLESPNEHRQILAKVVQISVECLKACIMKVCKISVSSTKTKKKLNKSEEMANLNSEFVVNFEKTFDSVVHLCFTHLGRCFIILLNPIEDKKKKLFKRKKKNQKKTSTSFKNWNKYRALTKDYLLSLIFFIDELEFNESVLIDGLKSIADLIDLYLHFPKICKRLIKSIVKYWSRRNEKIQSESFIILCKLIRFDNSVFPQVYKNCYVSYISNCKQVNSETLPLIKFMQKCFTEFSFLVPKQAYQFAFVYIRQFTVHLRNAVSAKKKDLIPSIYNWQFLNGLSLWTVVISQSVKTIQNFAYFKDLRHPLIEIIIILKKIFMCGKYLPLAILCIRLLIELQKSCKLFIPTLAMSLELLTYLQQIDKKKPAFGKKTEKSTDLSHVLRLSKLQLEDPVIRSLLGEEIFKLCLESAVAIKNNMAFPEIIVPLEIKLRTFIQDCKNPKHVELFKSFNQLLKEHAIEITKLVNQSSLNLKEYNNEFERIYEKVDESIPLTKFYSSYVKSLQVKIETQFTAEKKAKQKIKKLKIKKKQKKSL